MAQTPPQILVQILCELIHTNSMFPLSRIRVEGNLSWTCPKGMTVFLRKSADFESLEENLRR